MDKLSSTYCQNLNKETWPVLKNQISRRILRWLSYEEEEVNRINLPRIQYLVIEMSRKNIILVFHLDLQVSY
jgi:CRISPR/Cas system endoribonuclease Cas6 (RAMP superfamily)